MYIWFNGLILLTTVFAFEPCSQTAVFVEALMVSGVGSRVSRHFVSGVQATQTCPAVAVVFLFEESYLCNGMSFRRPFTHVVHSAVGDAAAAAAHVAR